MNILLLASHAVAEYDDVRMFHDLGYDVFAPGGYEFPGRSSEGIRPALPEVPYHQDLHWKCDEVRLAHGAPGEHIDWAKAAIHPDVIDWADVIICHHFPKVWLAEQWERLRRKRVIWRTCGQSDPDTETVMAGLDGLQIVRYSPKEREAFEPLGVFAGEDAVIRFGKYPSDYGPWIGDEPVIGNLTQDMYARGESTGLSRWQEITQGLPTKAAGKGSEVLGGVGALSYPDMLDYLRRLRTYLYLGTIPASYTLGLIEAMLSGVPVIARGWDWPPDHQWLGRLWEGYDILGLRGDPRVDLRILLDDPEYAALIGEEQRQRAVELFDVATVGAQWKAFLG